MTNVFAKLAGSLLPTAIIRVLPRLSITAYDNAYRNYHGFKALDDNQLRDIGLSTTDRDNAKLADFIR